MGSAAGIDPPAVVAVVSSAVFTSASTPPRTVPKVPPRMEVLLAPNVPVPGTAVILMLTLMGSLKLRVYWDAAKLQAAFMFTISAADRTAAVNVASGSKLRLKTNAEAGAPVTRAKAMPANCPRRSQTRIGACFLSEAERVFRWFFIKGLRTAFVGQCERTPGMCQGKSREMFISMSNAPKHLIPIFPVILLA